MEVDFLMANPSTAERIQVLLIGIRADRDPSQIAAFNSAIHDIKDGAAMIVGPPSNGKSRIDAAIAVAAALLGAKVKVVAPTDGAARSFLAAVYKTATSHGALGDFIFLCRANIGMVEKSILSTRDEEDNEPSGISHIDGNEAMLLYGSNRLSISAQRKSLDHRFSLAQTAIRWAREHRENEVADRFLELRAERIQTDPESGNSWKGKQEFDQKFRQTVGLALNETNILTTTPEGADSAQGRLYGATYLINEEAGATSVPQFLRAITAQGKVSTIVLADDPHQLPPTCMVASRKESEFAAWGESSVLTYAEKVLDRRALILTTEYRANPGCTEFVEKEVYKTRFTSAYHCEDKDLLSGLDNFFTTGPYRELLCNQRGKTLRFSVNSTSQRVPGETSLVNLGQAWLMQFLLELLWHTPAQGRQVTPDDVVILTAYTNDKNAWEGMWHAGIEGFVEKPLYNNSFTRVGARGDV